MLRYLLSIYILLLLTPSFAQRSMEERREQIENAKIAYITQSIDLNNDQATHFWPIYNEYSDKRRELKFQKDQLHDRLDDKSLSDAQLNNLLDKLMEIKQNEVLVDKTYKERLLKVISIRQLIDLYKAEKEFIRMVIRKAREKGYQR